jgi:hypothetical protein
MFGSQDLTFACCRFECGGKIHMSATKGDVANKRIEHREYWPSVKRDSNAEIWRQTMPTPARLAADRASVDPVRSQVSLNVLPTKLKMSHVTLPRLRRSIKTTRALLLWPV